MIAEPRCLSLPDKFPISTASEVTLCASPQLNNRTDRGALSCYRRYERQLIIARDGQGDAIRNAILMAYRHAQRSSELVSLRWDDVDSRITRFDGVVCETFEGHACVGMVPIPAQFPIPRPVGMPFGASVIRRRSVAPA
jgi:hypothetical protein